MEYYARQIGRLTGWVRNVDHDTVEPSQKGSVTKWNCSVEFFIGQMKQSPRMSLVDESRVERDDVTGEFQEFGVKRSM